MGMSDWIDDGGDGESDEKGPSAREVQIKLNICQNTERGSIGTFRALWYILVLSKERLYGLSRCGLRESRRFRGAVIYQAVLCLCHS